MAKEVFLFFCWLL